MKHLLVTFFITIFFVSSVPLVFGQPVPDDGGAPVPSGSIRGGGGNADYEPLVNIPGVSSGADRTLADFLNALFRVLLGVGAILAVVRITIAGLQYMASETSVGSKERAKEAITHSVLGLLLLLIIFLVLQVINPRLTDISFLDGAYIEPLAYTPSPREEDPTLTLDIDDIEPDSVTELCSNSGDRHLEAQVRRFGNACKEKIGGTIEFGGFKTEGVKKCAIMTCSTAAGGGRPDLDITIAYDTITLSEIPVSPGRTPPPLGSTEVGEFVMSPEEAQAHLDKNADERALVVEELNRQCQSSFSSNHIVSPGVSEDDGSRAYYCYLPG